MTNLSLAWSKPVIVNDRNKKFLMQLIRNGPDIYPGAKIYEKANGESISLRYVDIITLRLATASDKIQSWLTVCISNFNG